MPIFRDISGRRFGRLTVVACAVKASRMPRTETKWLCRCDCGSEKIIQLSNLRNGSTNSCGCIRNTQGGLTRKHPLWRRWDQMISRCTNETDAAYKNYGGRGIRVCRRWRSFTNFLEDMEGSFVFGATLERKNNNGPYSPSNVIWSTRKEQRINQRRTVFIDTPWGKMSVGEAASKVGIPIVRFISRVKKGWTTEQLFDPKNARKLNRWSGRFTP